jgi:hypothetical protein
MQMDTKVQQGDLLIASMLADPSLSQHEIAQALGISRSKVATVSQSLNKAIENAGSTTALELEAYRMSLRKQVTVEKRVGVIDKAISKASSNPFAALKAVEYADNILGLSPKQQQSQDVSDNTRPMFVLPAGTSISVTVNTPQQAIDITPLDTDSNDDTA